MKALLVDPLAVDDLSPVGRLLASPELEVILHDADYDLRILHRDYGFTAQRIWDTRVAAQLAGETAFGLGALLLAGGRMLRGGPRSVGAPEGATPAPSFG